MHLLTHSRRAFSIGGVSKYSVAHMLAAIMSQVFCVILPTKYRPYKEWRMIPLLLTECFFDKDKPLILLDCYNRDLKETPNV
jgi:hypothetical protein